METTRRTMARPEQWTMTARGTWCGSPGCPLFRAGMPASRTFHRGNAARPGLGWCEGGPRIFDGGGYLMFRNGVAGMLREGNASPV